MAWYEQLDLDFGSIQDQFTGLIGDVSLEIFFFQFCFANVYLVNVGFTGFEFVGECE